jgi:hypothetical protein
VHEGKRTRAQFEAARSRFGTLALVTDRRITAAEAYSLYKQRGEVEQAFDSFKNALEFSQLAADSRNVSENRLPRAMR